MSSINKDNSLQFLITVATIVGNYILGDDISRVSDLTSLNITPPGYTFGIWGVIYFLLILSSFRKNDISTVLYLLSAILNCSWIYIYTNEYIEWAAGVLIALNIILWKLTTIKKDTLTNFTFGIYAAWTLGAALLNMGSALLKITGIDFSSIILTVYAVVPFILDILFTKSPISCYFTFIWTAIAIFTKGIYEALIPIFSCLFIIIARNKIDLHAVKNIQFGKKKQTNIVHENVVLQI